MHVAKELLPNGFPQRLPHPLPHFNQIFDPNRSHHDMDLFSQDTKSWACCAA